MAEMAIITVSLDIRYPDQLRFRKASRFRIFLSLIISSALTVNPMKVATITDMKRYTGRLLFSAQCISGFIGFTYIEILDDKSQDECQTGASSRVMIRYCVLAIFDRISRVNKHTQLLDKAGYLERYGGQQVMPVVQSFLFR